MTFLDPLWVKFHIGKWCDKYCVFPLRLTNLISCLHDLLFPAPPLVQSFVLTCMGKNFCHTLYHTSAPKSNTPCSATGTNFSPIWTSRITLSTWDRLIVSLWHGVHLCTTAPSIPFIGIQPCQPFLPPFCFHSSFGHWTSIRRPKLMLSKTSEGSMIWNNMTCKIYVLYCIHSQQRSFKAF